MDDLRIFEHPYLSTEEKRVWLGKLNRQVNYCGCDEATFALLICLTVFLGLYHFGALYFFSFTFSSSAVVLGMCVASIGIGKLLGKIRGRIKAQGTVKDLKELISHRHLSTTQERNN
jgi:hypothetical protein